MRILRLIWIGVLVTLLASCSGNSSNSAGPGVIAVTGISLSAGALTIQVGGSTTLTVTLTPSNASNQAVDYASADATVATVSSNGTVSGVAAGTVTITVTSRDGDFTAEVAITVEEEQPSIVAVTGVTVDPASLALEVGATGQLAVAISPDNASDTSIIFTTSSDTVATVDAQGLITAIAQGNATITVTTTDGGFTGTTEVTVNAPVPAVSISVADSAVAEGDTGERNMSFTISLSSEAPGNVDVDVTTGNLTAIAGADYTALTGVTVTIPAGSSTTTVDVSVIGDLLIEGDETFTLTLSNPANAVLGAPTVATGTIQDDDSGAAPPELTAEDKPDVMPCPEQDILMDAGELADLQDGLLTGAIQFLDVPFNAGDADNFRKKCGFNAFWDPVNNTDEVSPAGRGMTSITLAQLLVNGNAGICTQGSTPGNFLEGFPAAGTYRGELKFAKGASTWHMRMRGIVTGSAAGNTFNNEGVSVPGDIENVLEYRVNGTVTPHDDLFAALVNAISPDASKVTIDISKTPGGDSVMAVDVEMICARRN